MKNYENIVAFMNEYATMLIESAKKHNESSVLLSYEFGMKDALNNARRSHRRCNALHR